MPTSRKINVLVLSNTTLDPKKIDVLVHKISPLENTEINFMTKATSGIEDAKSQIERDIHSNSYDILICTDDLSIQPLTLLDTIPQDRRPILIIDGDVHHILNREFAGSTFSGAVSIIKEDRQTHTTQFEFKGSYKEANIGVPNQISTHFNIGSVTKMMTSVAFAKLIDEENSPFSLDTPIHTSLLLAQKDGKIIAPFYLRVFSTIPTITPRQLLSHTSGLRDNLGKIFEEELGPEMLNFGHVRDYTEHFQAFEHLLPLESPGIYEYCNFGYQLLGLAIEAHKGDYYDYLQENVLRPAGMHETSPQRQSGHAFAAPLIKSISLPNLSSTAISAEKFQTATDLLNKARSLSNMLLEIEELSETYKQGLLNKMTIEEFTDFKNDITRRLTPLYNILTSAAYLSLLDEIRNEGIPTEMALADTPPENPKFVELNALSQFYAQLYDHLTLGAKPIFGILNSLSIASPDGRNMYSTVEDMFRFQQALSTGTLSAYQDFITTETRINNTEKNERYGFGCFVTGDEHHEDYTISHNGNAPGICAIYRVYPNKGYTLITLANNEENPYHIANLTEQKLIFGEQQSILYTDPHLTPNFKQSLENLLTNQANKLELDAQEKIHKTKVIKEELSDITGRPIKNPREQQKQDAEKTNFNNTTPRIQ